MASIGTFGSFTQARLAIYASQAGLSVTGNNISNINTNGYTRQKLDQTSFYAGGSDRYYSTYDLRIGNGTLCNGISQLRDPYLDIRYRTEMASVGAMDTKLAGLEDIQRVLDEVGDGDEDFGIISAQLSDFLHQLEQLSDQTGVDNYDIQVRSSAEALVKQFNSYAAQLEQCYENTIKDFEQDITTVNNILTNIRDLNSSIRKAEIHGDNALELRDERNVLIDQLSSYMKINAVYTEEDIGGGVMVEKLTISLDDANPDNDDPNSNDTAVLIDGIYARQLSIRDGSTDFDIDLSALKDSKDRLLYTLTKESAVFKAGNLPNGGNATTEEQADGTILITTYSPATGANGEQGYIEQRYTKTPSAEVQLADNDLYGSLQAQRELLTEKGEFASQTTIDTVDPNAATKRGIPFYQKALDLLANQFANVFNTANTPTTREQLYQTYVDADGVKRYKVTDGTNGTTDCELDTRSFTYNVGNETKTIRADIVDIPDEVPDDVRAKILKLQDEHLSITVLGHGFPKEQKGGVLFSNGDDDDTEDITAANISISSSWSKGPLIVNSFDSFGDLGVGSTDNSNILHMIALMDTKMDYKPKDIDPDAASDSMFNGTFSEMWVNIGSILGNDMMSTTTMLDTYYNASVELDTSRDGVSGVDLNDEAMNLMQYSKSYNAACRLMTTLDSVLDKLINGTGVTV